MPAKEAEKFADSTLMEGMTSIKAVISSFEAGISDRRVKRVMADAERAGAKPRDMAYLYEKSKKFGFPIELVGKDVIDEMTVGNSHGGIIAETTERTIEEISAEKISPDGFYVFLQGIEDPYNFGYCLRSLYAAGVSGIVLERRNWMSAAGVVCRASAGASELMPLFCGDTEKIVSSFKENGYMIVAADKDKKAVSVYDTELRFPLLLVVGGERRGITKEMLMSCDKTVMLDYGREFRAALSAASASSIIAFEIFRKNRHGGDI